MKMKALIGCVLLVLVTGTGFLFGMAQVRPEQAVVEVIELGSQRDQLAATFEYQPSDGATTTETNVSNNHQSENSTTDRSMEAVLAQLEALNELVLVLQDEVKHLSDESEPTVDHIAVAEQSAEQIELLDLEHDNKVYSETYQMLNDEEYDEVWAASVNDTLTNLIANHRLSDVMVTNLLCGETVCTVTLKQIQVNAQSTNKLLENLAWQGFSLKSRSRSAIDGTDDIEVLIGRDGRQFGANRQS